ncbi:hypothetical protein ACFXG4_41105 [Nocardia sp. NPDC059246]|uniref:hypothetical protein n=1 Tax=unclassified Nocardia TaxID=2637762 RepID=UPI0036C34B68
METTIYCGLACEECSRDDYDRCDDCHYLAVELHDVHNGDSVCSDCVGSYHECGDCSHLISYDEDYCSDCRYGRHDDRIQYYSYKPDPVFHGDGDLHLGLELEVKTRPSTLRRCVDIALEHLGSLGYLKEDGSIGNNGFEMVTHPMSYPWAIMHFPWAMLPELDAGGAYIDADVGIHVHVSRSGFATPAHVYRWMKFVYRNEFQATQLARRTSTEWANFDSDARAEIVNYAKGDREGFGRYQAINVYPEHTYEVRIFASSLHPQQVQAALAFVAASVEYTRELTSADIARRRGWEWTAFVTWVRSHTAYSPLLAEMEALSCAS